MLEVHVIPNGQFAENCYLLHETGGGDAVLVDPGEEASTREPPACHSCPPFVWVDDAHLLELRRDELLHLANERGRK